MLLTVHQANKVEDSHLSKIPDVDFLPYNFAVNSPKLQKELLIRQTNLQIATSVFVPFSVCTTQ